MPDTGASQSIVSAAIARDANLFIKPTFTELRNANNGVMTLLGEAETVLRNDKHSTRTVVLVASDLNHSAFIGWQDLQKLRVIPASFPAVAAVARCYSDLKIKNIGGFSERILGHTRQQTHVCATDENLPKRHVRSVKALMNVVYTKEVR